MELVGIIISMIVGVITIIGSMWAMLTFLLRDIQKDTRDIQKDMLKFESEMKEIKEDSKRMNMRLDGLYKILLDKVYGVGK